jgi:hypothetical protein
VLATQLGEVVISISKSKSMAQGREAHGSVAADACAWEGACAWFCVYCNPLDVQTVGCACAASSGRRANAWAMGQVLSNVVSPHRSFSLQGTIQYNNINSGCGPGDHTTPQGFFNSSIRSMAYGIGIGCILPPQKNSRYQWLRTRRSHNAAGVLLNLQFAQFAGCNLPSASHRRTCVSTPTPHIRASFVVRARGSGWDAGLAVHRDPVRRSGSGPGVPNT